MAWGRDQYVRGGSGTSTSGTSGTGASGSGQTPVRPGTANCSNCGPVHGVSQGGAQAGAGSRAQPRGPTPAEIRQRAAQLEQEMKQAQSRMESARRSASGMRQNLYAKFGEVWNLSGKIQKIPDPQERLALMRRVDGLRRRTEHFVTKVAEPLEQKAPEALGKWFGRTAAKFGLGAAGGAPGEAIATGASVVDGVATGAELLGTLSEVQVQARVLLAEYDELIYILSRL